MAGGGEGGGRGGGRGGGAGKGGRRQRLALARLTRSLYALYLHTNGETPGPTPTGASRRYALVDSDNGDGPVKSLIRRMRAKYASFLGTGVPKSETLRKILD